MLSGIFLVWISRWLGLQIIRAQGQLLVSVSRLSKVNRHFIIFFETWRNFMFLWKPISQVISHNLLFLFTLGTLKMNCHQTTNGLLPQLRTICSSICQKQGLFEFQDGHTLILTFYLFAKPICPTAILLFIFSRNQLVSLCFIKTPKFV